MNSRALLLFGVLQMTAALFIWDRIRWEWYLDHPDEHREAIERGYGKIRLGYN